MAARKARYPGYCAVCGGWFEAGTEIVWKPGRTKHADAGACAAVFAKAAAAEAAEKKAAWAAERAAMSEGERAYWAAAEWNTGHGLCPDGCCGVVVECVVPGCRCHTVPTAVKPHGGTAREAARGVGMMDAEA